MPTPALDIIMQFDRVTDLWSPKVIAQVNDQYLKVAKVQGSFVWHKHDEEDELFWVQRGILRIEFKDRDPVTIAPGQCYVVPRGILHNPVADEECWVVLIEPVATRHTGEVRTDRTRSIEEQLS